MHHRWLITIIATLGLSLVLAACGSDTTGGPGSDSGSPTPDLSPTSESTATATTSTIDPDLTGATWLLTDPFMIADTHFTLTFDAMTISGSDGCNQYEAELLTASDGQLQVGGISRTEMWCETPAGLMEQADRYIEGLSLASGYRIDGDQLQISAQNRGVLMLFMREGANAFDPALAADRWGLVEVNGEPAVPGSLVTLELSEGYVTGSNGCNGITGAMPLAYDGSIRMDFAGFARDARGCLSPEIQAQMETVDAMLEDATGYSLDNDRLTISDDDDNQLVYAPLADALLIGQTWNVPMLYTELPDGGVEGVALVEGTQITITFDADGSVYGTASCNNFRGTYTLDGASIEITAPLATTRMACLDPSGIMEQESTFLDTLAHIATWSIDPNGLTLNTDDGRALRELNPVLP